MASFENGVLTLTLSDGATLHGKVTEQTEIKCEAPQPTAHAADHGGDQGDSADDGLRAEQVPSDDATEEGAREPDENEQADEPKEEDQSQPSCGASSLKPGTIVGEAELRVSSSGAVFLNIELVG